MIINTVDSYIEWAIDSLEQLQDMIIMSDADQHLRFDLEYKADGIKKHLLELQQYLEIQRNVSVN